LALTPAAIEFPANLRHFILSTPLSLRHFKDNLSADMADEEVALYDEVEIEDCVYDETLEIYHHPCPCGDRFEISIADMRDGEDIARCPSCSLMIRIIFDPVSVLAQYQ
jgi:diphthamide biosynthesis protein 3